MKVASGTVDDSPFARTVFSLAAKRFTGDFILSKARKEYRSSWENGQIVAATSPSPADSPGRVALANGLVNSSTLGIFVQRTSDDPALDPLSVLAEVAKLRPEQLVTLKHRVLARAAARIFALPGAEFVVDNARSMSADPQLPPLDVRWLIYFGLRTHYSLERLGKELAAVGNRALGLAPKAQPMLPAFAFTDVEGPVLSKLQTQALSLANLVHECPEVDQATTTCVVYALMACGYLAYGEEQPAIHPSAPLEQVEQARINPAANQSPKVAGPAGQTVSTKTVQGVGFVNPNASNPDAIATNRLIKSKLALLKEGADHYALLGVDKSVADGDLRGTYFSLAKQLHPDRLQAVGIKNLEQEVQQLFAAINKAFAVLSSFKNRAEYNTILAAGGEKAYAAAQREAEEMAMKILRAEEHYHIGEMALRRDQYGQAEIEFGKAVELSPDESEYIAKFAWASYCNAKDRASVEREIMGKMSSALLKGPKSVETRLYHAKLLKLMGRDEEALNSFGRLLEMSPGHREGELEMRILSKRKP